MWFFKDKINKIEKTEPKPTQAKIIFSVVDGKIDIECMWSSDEENELELAMELGQLISSINCGVYTEELFEILEEYSKLKPESRDFIQDVMAIWTESNAERQKEIEEKLSNVAEEPIIRPLRVFRQSSMFKE